uniref:Uncharacterized protein n=1 Tax=Lates calcarifer TaxID=8187 RepID=A0A4W6DBB3_LATCA
MIVPGGGCRGFVGGGGGCGDPCSLFQTQATQTMLQSREGPAMPRMAILLGLMGIGMSSYSSRQLTLHYKPSTSSEPPHRQAKMSSLSEMYQTSPHKDSHTGTQTHTNTHTHLTL